jgi:hypothetical protein
MSTPSVASSAPAELDSWIERIETELFRSVLPFWFRHSYDSEQGGFFSCLDRNGERYDDRKFMWLNGRQVSFQISQRADTDRLLDMDVRQDLPHLRRRDNTNVVPR